MKISVDILLNSLPLNVNLALFHYNKTFNQSIRWGNFQLARFCCFPQQNILKFMQVMQDYMRIGREDPDCEFVSP